jgi:hemoglobin/transferrin/lactoferrin receptor protein
VWAYSINTDFQKKWNKNTLQYGAECIINDIKSMAKAVDISNGNILPVADRYPQSTWSSYAVYLNYLQELSEKLSLQVGGRFNGFAIQSDFTRHLEFYPFDFTTTSLNNSATTGSLGLVYRPNNTTKISISGGTAFRAPNVDDIGKIFDFGPDEIVVPNANLKAEYAYNGELNISKIFKDVVRCDASAYYTYLNNALVRRTFQVNGQDSILFDVEPRQVFAIQNAAFATVIGFHIGVEIKLPGGFGIESRYNYQFGNEQMGNGEISRSRHAAPGFGISRITYNRAKLQMQLYAHYAAEVSHMNLNEEERQKRFIYARDNNGNSYSPSWYTLSFKAMYQFHPNFTVSAGLENITDQRYRPYSSGLVAGGRNFILSLRANF